MAKIVVEVRECMTKVSPQCAGSFERIPQRGRPPVSCVACREVAKVAASTKSEDLNRECPCGNTFQVKQGRGRRATKCESCREAGTVYRANDEGIIEEIRAETLRQEAQEKAEQAGKDRAENLFKLMQPLLTKRNRQVIVR